MRPFFAKARGGFRPKAAWFRRGLSKLLMCSVAGHWLADVGGMLLFVGNEAFGKKDSRATPAPAVIVGRRKGPAAAAPAKTGKAADQDSALPFPVARLPPCLPDSCKDAMQAKSTPRGASQAIDIAVLKWCR
jgi:hypothetical protein